MIKNCYRCVWLDYITGLCEVNIQDRNFIDVARSLINRKSHDFKMSVSVYCTIKTYKAVRIIQPIIPIFRHIIYRVFCWLLHTILKYSPLLINNLSIIWQSINPRNIHQYLVRTLRQQLLHLLHLSKEFNVILWQSFLK